MPSIEDDVNKLTSDRSQEEDWTAIIEICHQITVSHGNTPQNYLNVIMKRLKNPNPNVAMKAITLLDACYSNCGKKFQRFLARREFTDELRRLLGHVSQLHERVRERLRGLLQNWATENEHDPEMNLLCVAYQMLKRDGVSFPDSAEAETGSTNAKTTDSATKKKEEDDVKKAIAASLKEEQKLVTPGVSSMYPAVEGLALGGGGGAQKKAKIDKFEALFDFEAGEDNELSFKSGDLIEILDNSDENWWKGQLRGKVGLFPKTFVSKHVPGQSQAKRERDKEKKERSDRDKKVDINEDKLNLTLEMLKKADAHSEASVEDRTLKDLEQQCELMRPLISQKIDHFQAKYDRLMEINVKFRDSMALYQKLLKESSDAYRHTQAATAQEQAPPVYHIPQYLPQYPPAPAPPPVPINSLPQLGRGEQSGPSLIPDLGYPSYPPGPYPPTAEQPPPFQVAPGAYPSLFPQGTPLVYPGGQVGVQQTVLPVGQGYSLPQL